MFVPETTLEGWVGSGRVELDGTLLTIGRHKRRYRVEPAVRILKIVAGAPTQRLLGKVVPTKRISELGGDIYGDSVVFGDMAFEVRPGFIARFEGGK